MTNISPEGYESLRQNLFDQPAPAAAASAPSVMRLGKYLVKREVGRGGMGVVYEAQDMDLKRRVALKLIREGDASPALISRLHREAAIAAQLQNPNIVAIHEVGLLRDAENRATHFIAMDFVDGNTLADVLLERSPDRRTVLAIIETIARAVAVAHSKGIVHRDIKPANILIDLHGRTLLTDFGLARAENMSTQLTQTQAVIGTPYYMAPEQVQGAARDIDARTDVYALGVVLYEALAGVVPYKAETQAVVYQEILRGEPVPPGRLAKVENELQVICLKAMDKDREQRYASATEFADDLRRFLEGEPIQARPPSLMYIIRKRIAKRRAVLVVAGAGLLAVGLVFLVMQANAHQAERAAAAARIEALERLRGESDSQLQLILALRRAGDLNAAQQKLTAARVTFAEVIRNLPELAEPHYRLGRIYRALMRDDDAESEQDKALKLDPNYGPSLYERIVLTAKRHRIHQHHVYELGLQSGVRGGQGEAAQSLLTEKMERQLEADLSRLLPLVREGKAAIGPGEIQCAQGLRERTKGRSYENAVACLKTAMQISPLLEEAIESLAWIYFGRGEFEEAIRILTIGLDKDRGYLPYLDTRGMASLYLADCGKIVPGPAVGKLIEAAQVDYTAWVEKEPESVDALRMLGHAIGRNAYFQMTLGRDPNPMLDEALKVIERALKINPHDGPAWGLRGRVAQGRAMYLSEQRKNSTAFFQAAIEDYDHAISLAPDLDAMWRTRGAAKMMWAVCNQGAQAEDSALLQSAIEDLDHAIQMAPEHPGNYYFRGMCYVALAQNDFKIERKDPAEMATKALVDLKMALSMKLISQELYRNMGLAKMYILLPMGMDSTRDAETFALAKESLADFNRSLELDPGNSSAMNNRGALHFVLGEIHKLRGTDGRAEYQAALDDYGLAIKRAPWLAQALERALSICRNYLDSNK